jgi:hypothetical protein
MWQDAGHSVKAGTVGASFQAKVGEKSRAIFWAYPENVQNAFGEFSKFGVTDQTVNKYWQAVAALPGFNRADVLSKSQPTSKFEPMSEDSIRAFVSVSDQFVQDWRSAVTSSIP